jgi:hypothetical protein
MSEEEKVKIKMMVQQYQNIVSALDPVKVFTWFPKKYIAFFKAIPGGENWVYTQLQIIKEYICS